MKAEVEEQQAKKAREDTSSVEAYKKDIASIKNSGILAVADIALKAREEAKKMEEARYREVLEKHTVG